MKVLSLVPFDYESFKKLKEKFPKVDFLERNQLKEDDVIDVMLGWDFNDGLNLIQQHHIKWVQSVSAGVDYFPLEEFEKNNVILTSASGLNSQRVANFVLLQCLSDSYSINEAYINRINRKWKVPENIYDIREKNIIIFGTGSIGKSISEVLSPFVRNIYGVNTSGKKSSNIFDATYKIGDIIEGKITFSNIDIVINCLPETSQTTHIFDNKLLKKFSKPFTYISIGRGETTNTSDLIQFVDKGDIKTAFLDVFEQEPLPKDSKIWENNRIIVTPHISGMLPHFRCDFFELFSKNLYNYCTHKELNGIVDYKKGY